MKQWKITVKRIAYKQFFVCGKAEGAACGEAMYMAKITDWNDSDRCETDIQSIEEMAPGD